jgi:hypothetical protein
VDLEMNFKQKLAYMALGCIFTVAGYILANLGGNGFAPEGEGNQKDGGMKFAPPKPYTKPKVIDEIVCRKLKLVDSEGKTVALLEKRPGKNAAIDVFTVYSSATGEEAFALRTSIGNGVLILKNYLGKAVFSAGGYGGSGFLDIGNGSGKAVVRVDTRSGHGIIETRNELGSQTDQLGNVLGMDFRLK